MDNLRAIRADYARIGDQLWSRFNAGTDDQLWYYLQVVEACKPVGATDPLIDELEKLVSRIRSLTL